MNKLLTALGRLPVATARALPVPGRSRMSRRSWVGNGRAHIEVRGLDRPGSEAFAKQVEEQLERLHGVHWAEVNAVLGRVVVAFTGDRVDVDDLVDAIEDVEEAHELHTAGFPKSRPEHPADDEPLHRQLVALGSDALGLALSTVRPVLRQRTFPSDVLSVLALVDSTPRLRHALYERFGRAATDLTLAVTHAIASGLTPGPPVSVLTDAAYRAVLISEINARRTVWQRREPDLQSRPDGERAEPVDVSRRPVPVPPGPIERYADRASFIALTAAAGAVAVTRDRGRARTALTVIAPRAARLSREVFAARLGRALCARGVVPLDATALRRLDRLDTVVIDSRALTTGRFAIGELRGAESELSPEEESSLRVRAGSLMDAREPGAVRTIDDWTLGPLSKVVPGGQRLARTVADQLRAPDGVTLGLVHGDTLVAVLAAVPELRPNATDLVAAARSVGTVILAGVGSGLGARISADAVVPAGTHLASEIRKLQQQQRMVALVADARAGNAAMAAADCGVGVLDETGPVPWAADLLCGPGLAQACRILDAVTAARTVARRGALISLYGSVAAALLALSGPAAGQFGRARIAGTAAAVVGMTVGALAARSVDERPDPVPIDETPWHALAPETALRRLDSSPDGLTAEDAAARLAEQPSLDGHREERFLRATVDELANPLTPLLATGAAMSAATGSVTDATLIGSVMGANALLGAAQRVSADRALRRLARDTSLRAQVRRNGHELDLAADEIVPGDVIVLRAGDAVPADCRILEAANVEVDESTLTGESQLVTKTAMPLAAASVAERRSMLYEGTIVAAGEATCVVVATGPRSEMGRSGRAAETGPPTRGVQARLMRLTGASVPIALGSGAALIAGGLLRGRPLSTTLGTAVSLAVAAVPEGLPLVATVGQIAAARRLSQRRALVRDPSTTEALGRVDVLCFDKTGTLTEGRVRLQQVSDGLRAAPVDQLSPTARPVLAAGLRASPAARDEVPHPTDRAVITGAEEAGVTPADGLGHWRVVGDMPFEPARGYHAALGATSRGLLLSVKGAPETVLPACTGWRRNGRVERLDSRAVASIETEVDRLARQGYRVLAVAQRPVAARRQIRPELVADLEFLGLLGLADSARPEAAAAVAGLRRAGVKVIMLTGDHPTTAEAIAAELDIVNGGRVMTGSEIDELDDGKLAEVLPEVSVFARVTPTHKVRIVQALQTEGHTVAMTGDGANDAAAIRLADVGIALGQRGTDAARESADLIVTDDRIETIIHAVVEGRAMWASVRDAVSVLVGGNLGEIGFALGTGLLAPAGSPLNARQLLLVNLLTDLLPSLALSVREPSKQTPEDLLHEGPEASLGRSLTRDVAVRALATAGATTGAWLIGRGTGTRTRASTVALVALVGTQLGQTLVAGWRSPLVVGASAVSAAALGAIVQTPGVSQFFGCRPMGPIAWTTGLWASGIGTAAAMVASRLAGRVWPEPGQPDGSEPGGGTPEQ
ncbi:cation-transporting P-type ATPase [Planosporangium thailandense]|uniref:Cation-transporting P-type ATPase n=1 Tax=Planosporangium thailandense TaxID=765197 RepID=A0ABX0Y616_9ACTN|nr:cation-transporting P-type ATPase [Planosporangium thailandense]NJC73000.1 cation-transporting P-type ATPase [Planosporangium thailandense]